MPNPDKFRLQVESSALLVIDVQERLSAAMDPAGLQQLVRNAGILLESAQELSIPVIVTEQYVKGLGPSVAALKEKMSAASFCEKLSFSCCGEEGFVAQLRQSGRTQIVVCGMEAHVCVQQSVLDLLHAGFDVHVVKDAVMSRANANRDTAIEAMTLAGAVPASTEAVLFQWLRVAGTDVFRKLSKLVK